MRATVPHLSEQDGQHVLPLEADGQVHQSEAHVERRGPVEELHLVRGELPSDVAARRLVGLHRGQVPLHHTFSTHRGKRKEGKRKNKKNKKTMGFTVKPEDGFSASIYRSMTCKHCNY